MPEVKRQVIFVVVLALTVCFTFPALASSADLTPLEEPTSSESVEVAEPGTEEEAGSLAEPNESGEPAISEPEPQEGTISAPSESEPPPGEEPAPDTPSPDEQLPNDEAGDIRAIRGYIEFTLFGLLPLAAAVFLFWMFCRWFYRNFIGSALR